MEVKAAVDSGVCVVAPKAGTITYVYGKTLSEAVEIGSYLAASVITTSDNVCPRFLPSELGLDVEVVD